MRQLGTIFAITAACVSHAALAACPISECDYSDPRYQAAHEKYKALSDINQRCIDPAINSFSGAVDRLTILYPRFGIAYRAMQDEIKAATAAYEAAVNDAWVSANNAVRAAFAAAEHAYVAAHPAATVLDIQAYVYADPSYIAASAAAKAASDPDNAAGVAAVEDEKKRTNEAQQRFDDRILHTAEPEALKLYNLYQLKVRQQAQRCGPAPPMPEPPRK